MLQFLIRLVKQPKGHAFESNAASLPEKKPVPIGKADSIA